jgi:hypothetical protein
MDNLLVNLDPRFLDLKKTPKPYSPKEESKYQGTHKIV